MQFGLKWCAWFQNECEARVWFEVTSMIWDQNCTKSSSIITLLHPFWNCKIQLLKYRIFKSVLIFYWSSIELVLIYKKRILLFSCNVIGSFKQALKSDWLLCFSKTVSLAGKKKCYLEHKMVQFVNNLHQWEPIRLKGSPDTTDRNNSLSPLPSPCD